MSHMGQWDRLFTAGVLVLALSVAVLSPITAQSPGETPDAAEWIRVEDVMAHVQALAGDIGPRPLGTDAERHAAEYISAQLRAGGYDVTVQIFGTIAPEACELPDPPPLLSRNVIAIRRGESLPDEVIVVGAHMDSVAIGQGAGDNASGVAAMLAAAHALAGLTPSRTLVFVAFGANEGGCLTGSDAFIQTHADLIARSVAMINVDNVGLGATLNAYAGAVVTWGGDGQSAPESVEGGPVWLRDLALAQAEALGHALGATPAESWNGYIGDWGDHIGFVERGIPVVYLEAWGWHGASVDDAWWGAETSAGDLSHTAQDRVEAIHPAVLEAAAETLTATLHALAVESVTIPGR